MKLFWILQAAHRMLVALFVHAVTAEPEAKTGATTLIWLPPRSTMFHPGRFHAVCDAPTKLGAVSVSYSAVSTLKSAYVPLDDAEFPSKVMLSHWWPAGRAPPGVATFATRMPFCPLA